MLEICKPQECTGCGACYNVCPQNAIQMGYNEKQELVPIINQEKCIECQLCKKICPNNTNIVFNTIKEAYAAWNLDIESQETSTSGAIATSFYETILKEDGFAVGCDFNHDFELIHRITQKKEDITKFKKSKYVQSYIGSVYKEVKECLKDGKKVLFIGTPCQISGLKSYLKEDNANIILVDILCHGVPSNIYLKNHINYAQKKNVATQLDFREKEKYVFKLKNNEKEIYKHSATEDLYLIGFLNNLLERESCFSCKYAKEERVSDLTIGDFWGIGKQTEFKKPDNVKVSLVLVNTQKGVKFLEKCKENLYLEKREKDEAINGNRVLRQPITKHKNYDKFRSLYSKKGYQKAIKICLKREIRRGRITYFKSIIKRKIRK